VKRERGVRDTGRESRGDIPSKLHDFSVAVAWWGWVGRHWEEGCGVRRVHYGLVELEKNCPGNGCGVMLCPTVVIGILEKNTGKGGKGGCLEGGGGD